MRKVFVTGIGLLLIVLLLACAKKADQQFVTDGNYTYEVFRPIYDSVVEDKDVAALCLEFIENSDDIELCRRVQGYWMRMDMGGNAIIMEKLMTDNPSSAKYAYLYGRTVEDPMKQIQIGRDVVELDPTFPYGYRLITAAYLQNLFNGDKSDENYNTLKSSLSDDESAFVEAAQLETGDIFYPQVLTEYYLFTGKYPEAFATLEAGKKLQNDRWPTPADYAVVYAAQGDFKTAKQTVTEQYADMEDKEKQTEAINNTYYQVLTSAKAYDQIVTMLKSEKGYDKDPNMLYNIACTYSLKGDAAKGIEYLSKAADAGWYEIAHTKRDTDLNALHASDKWEPTLNVIQANWDAGKDDRKAEVLASKISEPAPMWELEDENGNIVKLADLKGNVVILDFWATWCGPCKLAMPVIDNYLKSEAPENVKIFSINVWEKGRQNPVNFMKEHQYAMKLLYGNDQVVEQYGFNGIPFLCVIDKEGNIRYKHIGYTDALNENLEFWVNDLI